MKNDKKNMVLLIIGIICLILVGCLFAKIMKPKVKYIDNDRSINRDNISKNLEIQLNNNADIKGQDFHIQFFYEGYTILKIKDDGLYEKIKNSSNWKDSNDEKTSYVELVKSRTAWRSYYSEIKSMNNYMWLYKIDYSSNNPIYIDSFDDSKGFYSGTYFLSLYDIDNDTLYYYQYDY